MKRAILIFFLIVFSILFFKSNAQEEIIIPNESIRIRVIANSNTKEDQVIKEKVKRSVQVQLSNYLRDAKNIEDVRRILNDKLSDIDWNVSKELTRASAVNNYSVDYGYNYFPNKTYKGIKYQEGYYESIVIKLGESKGQNWWCVLFPPLCLIDEDNNMEEIQYKSFVKELIDKYF